MTRDGAAKGNIQAFDQLSATLRIVAQRGFSAEFLRHFEVVKAFDSSVCGRAAGLRSCLIVPDVLADEAFAPHRRIAQAEGFRSVKSLPIIAADGRFCGILSTHAAAARWSWSSENTAHVAEEIAALLASRPSSARPQSSRPG